MMAKRLLSETFDQELETFCLTTLELKFGRNWVRHLRQMLKDVQPETVACSQNEFDEYVRLQNVDFGFDFRFHLLKQSHWPSFCFEDCNINFVSAGVAQALSCLKRYVKGRNNTKNLHWVWHSGMVVGRNWLYFSGGRFRIQH